jgi:NAD(P)H-dependent FMN reductase
MNKQEAYKKYAKAEKATAENIKAIFPTKAELLAFYDDVKGLCWPEFYGVSPWETASFIAHLAQRSGAASPFVLGSPEYKAAMSYKSE